MIHRAALISVSLALSQTPALHCKTTDTGLMHHTEYLFTPQFLLALTAPTHGGTARMS